ncbi:unnamed protein product [Soboliphyme baturini]|uniref:AD domain-containing protein n=1 Tax=Soboliphyme baturini TaxID=241478 RepID=A0A183IJM8_9BILA|nr:unnamed protein product [Soboliphyme baturini]
MAYDNVTRLLVLKSALQNGKTHIQLVNLNLVRDVTVVSESSGSNSSSTVLPQLNFAKIQKRAREESDKKLRSVCSSRCTREGRRLFLAIRKTIEDVSWDRENIVVLHKVEVRPPYNVDHVEVLSGVDMVNAQSALEHVRKILEKYKRDQSNVDLEKDMDSIPSMASVAISAPPLQTQSSTS